MLKPQFCLGSQLFFIRLCFLVAWQPTRWDAIVSCWPLQAVPHAQNNDDHENARAPLQHAGITDSELEPELRVSKI